MELLELRCRRNCPVSFRQNFTDFRFETFQPIGSRGNGLNAFAVGLPEAPSLAHAV